MQGIRVKRSACVLSVVVLFCSVLFASTAIGASYTATWSGGATGNYSVAGNWTLDPPGPVVVPLNDTVDSYSVVIPNGVTVTFDVLVSAEIDQLTLGQSAALVFPSGSDLTIVLASSIAGSLQSSGGVITSTVGATFAGDEAKVLVDGGSAVLSPVAYDATGVWRSWDPSGSYGDQVGTWYPNLFRANAGSLDLSSLATWTSDFNSPGNDHTYQTVSVSDGGQLDLSALVSVAGPRSVRDRLIYSVSGVGSSLDLGALTTISCAVGRYNDGVRFDLSSDVPLVFSSLSEADQLRVSATSGALASLPSLATCEDSSFVATGGAQISATRGPIAFSARDIWRNWDPSGSYGDQVGSWNPVLISAAGAGTMLNLSGIATWDSGFTSSGNDHTYQMVTVSDGGTLDLGGLLAIDGPRQARDRLDFNVSGVGTTLDVSALADVTCAASRYNTAVRFDLSSNVPVDFSSLVNLDQGTVKVSNGAVASAPQLTTCSDTSFLVSGGGSFVANSSAITYSATQIWRNWDPSGSYGDQVGSWNPVLMSVVGAGSILDLSGIVEWNSNFNSTGNDHTYQTVSVSDQGALDLGGLVLMTTPRNARDRIDVSLSGSGSSIDVSSLAEIRCLSTRYNEGVNFALSADASVMFNSLASVDRARFSTTGGASAVAPALAQIHDTDFVVGAGSSFVGGPGPMTFSALNIWRNWDPSGSYGDQSGSWSPNLMNVTGVGALLDLSGIESWDSGFDSTGNDKTRQTVTVADGGTLLLGALAELEGPVETRDFLEFFISGSGASVDLSSLTEITCQSSRYNTATRFYFSSDLPAALPALSLCDRASLVATSGASLQLPVLDVLTNSGLSAQTGASIVLGSNPTSYSTLGLWRNWDPSGSYGDQVGTHVPAILTATDPGSLLDLSSITSIDAGFSSNGNDHTYQTINVSGGATLDLSGTTQIELPVSSRDRLDLLADGAGSVLDLSSLQGFARPGSGAVRFIVGDGALARVGNASVNTGEYLTCTNDATIVLGESFFFTNTNEAQVRCDSGRIRFEGAAAQALEVGGVDNGALGATTSNFGMGQLVAGRVDLATTVRLLDATNNGNRVGPQSEALYLYGVSGEDGLRVLGGSTVIIDSVNVYARVAGTMVHLNTLFPVGTSVIAFDQGFLQLDQPGDTESLRILYHAPHGPVDTIVDHIDVRFSRPIVPGTFDASDVQLTTPSGPVAVQAPLDLGDGFWQVPFPPQMLNGTYTLVIGPDIADLDLGLLDQDGDDSGGEVGQDEYSATFDLFIGIQVVLEQPVSRSVHLPGTPVSFAASSTSGSLDPVDYEWSSDLDGVFSTGAMFEYDGLSSGMHTITVTATDSVSADSDQSSIVLQVLDPPDLTTTVTESPGVGYAGGLVVVTWMVTNSVSSTLDGLWTDALYLGLDSDFGNAVRLGEAVRPFALDGGESYLNTASIVVPTDWPEGPLWIFVVADADAELTESDDANNVTSVSATLAHIPRIAQLPAASVVEHEVYLGAEPQLLSGTAPVAWSVVEGPSGLAIDGLTGQVTWSDPIARSQPYAITIRAENPGGSDDMVWNLSVAASYTASVAVAPELAPAGTTITFSGVATRFQDAMPAPEAEVKIELEVQGMRRTISAVTDLDGFYSIDWEPLPSEAGVYEVAAGHPAETFDEFEASFTLIGIRCEPDTWARTLTEGGRAASEVILVRNLGDVPVSGISAQVVASDPSLSVLIDSAPASLDPLAGAELAFSVQAVAAAPSPASFTIELTDTVGAVATLIGTVAIVPASVELQAVPASLQTGMLRGAQSFVELDIVNIGSAPSGSLEVLVPAAPWMTLATTSELPSIAPGERATVVLSLQPALDLPLGPYTGAIVVNGDTTGVTVPFEFVCISDGVGSLRVDAVDEFTYYGAGSPGVDGASVVVRDAYTDIVVESGTTDPNGSITFGALPEAYYRVDVSAPDHGAFQTTILLVAGEERVITAFLPRQLVTYVWSVVPTLIGDAYEIIIEVIFETDVPAPVVTVDPAYVDLQDMEVGDARQVDYTFTNHGLVAAQNFRLFFQQFPGHSITPLVEDLQDLEAGGVRTVPVMIVRTSAAAASGGGSGSQGLYDLLCGGVLVPYSVPWFYGLGSGGAWAPPSSGSGPPSPGVYGGPSPSSPPPSGGEGMPWTPSTPFVSHIPIGGILSVLCHPCTRALWDCFLTHTPLGEVVGLADQAQAIAACLESCFALSLQNCWECLRDLTLPVILPEWGDLQSAITCAQSLLACAGSLGLGGSATAAAVLEYEVERLERTIAPWIEIVGNPDWFQAPDVELDSFGSWFAEIEARMEAASPDGVRLSVEESAEILALGPPSHLSEVMLTTFIERWNRTVDYWELGIFSVDDVPMGDSVDFIARDRMVQLLGDSNEVLLEYAAEGRERIDDAMAEAAESLQASFYEGPGVCARVELRIEHSAVLTRDAFLASLQLANGSDMDSIGSVSATIAIEDADGIDRTDRFGIPTPTLSGITDVSGSGSVPPDSVASAEWTIIPTSDAAPDAPQTYFVRGFLSYSFGGESINIPLYPVPVTVLPSPELTVDYFLERDVYGDHPFTPEVEPSVPFSLGMIMTNFGGGPAQNVRVTSAQPVVVDDSSGLLIDFLILGTRVGSELLAPSLTVDLGDLDPGAARTAQWVLESSLQGEFVDYAASFEHIDGLGDPRLSLIESVEIFETEHVVRIEIPSDDSQPDFLTNETPDAEGLPDRVHSSDGTVEDVFAWTTGAFDGTASSADLEVELTVTPVEDAWNYWRLPSPIDGELRLVSVLRSDGVSIRTPQNAWTTSRLVPEMGETFVAEDRLHLFDFGGTGIYTLQYALIDSEPPVVQEVMVDPVLVVGQPNATITVTYQDDMELDVSSLDSLDLRVTGPGGFDELATFVAVDSVRDGAVRMAQYLASGVAGDPWTIANNGSYSIAVEPGEVFDVAGNPLQPGPIGGFEVAITLPVVSVTNPAPGVVFGAFSLGATATDPEGVVGIEFAVREPGGASGIPIGWENIPGFADGDDWSGTFDSTVLDEATYWIVARAVDSAGNEATSAPVVVDVMNQVAIFPGDVNNDGSVQISDAVALVSHLFSGGVTPTCRKAGDVNDDDLLDVADAVGLLTFLFQGGTLVAPDGTILGMGMETECRPYLRTAVESISPGPGCSSPCVQR